MIEYLDIVGKNGNPTGETASRDEVHTKGLLHRQVHAWILNSDNEVLLQKRSPDKKLNPNQWSSSIGGHIPAGRTPDETVKIEGGEELGIDFHQEKLKPAFSYSCTIKFENGLIENGINIVYFIKRDILVEKIKIQKSEVADVKWMDLKAYKHEIDSQNPSYRAYPEEFPKLFEYSERNK